MFVEEKEKPINYIVAARFYEPIQRIIAGNQVWTTLDEGIEISELQYKSQLWGKSRRMIVVRQKIEKRPKAAGKMLKRYGEVSQGCYCPAAKYRPAKPNDLHCECTWCARFVESFKSGKSAL